MRPGQILQCGVLVGAVLAAVLSARDAERHTGTMAPDGLPFSLPLPRQSSILAFEPNRGQLLDGGDFLVAAGAGTFQLSPTGMRWDRRIPGSLALRTDETPFGLRFAGGSATARLAPEGALRGRANYYTARELRDCQLNVPFYRRLRSREVWPGIDVVWHTAGPDLEYDFVVAPGADPGQIRLAFEGVDDVRVSSAGDLLLRRGKQEVRQRKPRVYQDLAGGRRRISAGYVPLAPGGSTSGAVGGRSLVNLQVGAYDRRAPLVIDPVLVYGTLVRQASTSGNDDVSRVWGTAVKSDGTIVIVGQRDTVGIFEEYDPDEINQESIIRKSSLPSSDIRAVAVDAADRVYLAGTTDNPALPLTNAVQADQPGRDAFVARFTPDGVREFLTYLGGENTDEANALSVALNNQIVVAGTTNSRDFPNLKGPFRAKGLGYDAFVTKLDLISGSGAAYAVAMSTFLGGNGDDIARAVQLAPRSIGTIRPDKITVAGQTDSGNFPRRATIFDPAPSFSGDQGGVDAFVAQMFLEKDSRALGASYAGTYLGGAGTDVATGLVDFNGITTVAGFTGSFDFPADGTVSGPNDAFITQFSQNQVGFVNRSRFIGGSGRDGIFAMARGLNNEFWLTGITTSTNFPTVLPLSGFAQKQGPGDNSEAAEDSFLIKLNLSLINPVLFSTFLGGANRDLARAVSTLGNRVVVGGETLSSNFPALNGDEAIVGSARKGFGIVVQDTPPPPGAGLSGFWGPLRVNCSGQGAGRRCVVMGAFTIQSQGIADAPRTVLRFLLSDDDVVDGTDMLLKEQRVRPIASARTLSVPFAGRVRGEVTGKRVLAVVDATNVIAEPREDNNVIATPPLP